MSERHALLVEVGTEELPPKALLRLSESLQDNFRKGLDQAGLSYGKICNYATPRRLALLIEDVPIQQPERSIDRRGPAVSAAFDADGCPTKAALGFAKSCKVNIEALDTLETPKGAWLYYKSVQQGQQTAELIPKILTDTLAALPIPKRMRWSDLDAEFVRPVHWLTLMLGNQVIEMELMGISAGRLTYGHRFHHPQPIHLPDPQAYSLLLKTQGHVLASFQERRSAILAQIHEVAMQLHGEAKVDDALLDEVTALVEWPVTLSGQFDKRYLDVPAEALISSMQGHQKFFPVFDKHNQLMPYFIVVSNIESKEIEQVKLGNERVIRPRLADAAFFWTQDRKTSLAKRCDSLRQVVYHKKLGSLHAKTNRVADLAKIIAGMLPQANADWAYRAGQLSKADLMTEMVGEFPELQGTMGCYYAVHDQEPAEVARALDEQYMPRYAGDQLAQTPTGQVLALAERIDTLVGIFGIGMAPTGDKDPFGLRRAALGCIRIIIEKQLPLDIAALLQSAYQTYAAGQLEAHTPAQVGHFIFDRLRGYCLDHAYPHDVFEAIHAIQITQLYDFEQRARALTEFLHDPHAHALAAANKRIHNILRKTEQAIPASVTHSLLSEASEIQLYKTLTTLEKEVTDAVLVHDYQTALLSLATLRAPVDAFFDAVMVMDEDLDLRTNRLALLKQLRGLFLQVADFSILQETPQ